MARKDKADRRRGRQEGAGAGTRRGDGRGMDPDLAGGEKDSYTGGFIGSKCVF